MSLYPYEVLLKDHWNFFILLYSPVTVVDELKQHKNNPTNQKKFGPTLGQQKDSLNILAGHKWSVTVQSSEILGFSTQNEEHFLKNYKELNCLLFNILFLYHVLFFISMSEKYCKSQYLYASRLLRTAASRSNRLILDSCTKSLNKYRDKKYLLFDVYQYQSSFFRIGASLPLW